MQSLYKKEKVQIKIDNIDCILYIESNHECIQYIYFDKSIEIESIIYNKSYQYIIDTINHTIPGYHGDIIPADNYIF